MHFHLSIPLSASESQAGGVVQSNTSCIRDVQYPNASNLMSFTELPMVTEVGLEQPKNALSPMLVTELGMVMEVRFEQLENAQRPMLVTPFEISKSLISVFSSQ